MLTPVLPFKISTLNIITINRESISKNAYGFITHFSCKKKRRRSRSYFLFKITAFNELARRGDSFLKTLFEFIVALRTDRDYKFDTLEPFYFDILSALETFDFTQPMPP